jgi:hypothetical protein
MKSKKARKRLRQVDGLLAAVIKRYRSATSGVHELLDTAKKAVDSAMISLQKPVTKKPPASAGTPGQRRLSAAGRKRLSAAAKKRWAIAKSKGIHAATGRPLHKTA